MKPSLEFQNTTVAFFPLPTVLSHSSLQIVRLVFE